MIALSCGIKISAVHNLVLSQCTRVTDRQTDGRTDIIMTPKTSLACARGSCGKNHFLSHPFGDLAVTYTLHQLVGKPVVNILFVIIEFFRYLLRLRHFKRKSVEVGTGHI